MGKRLIVQRRGRGSPTFTANKRGKYGKVKYPFIKGTIGGIIVDILHERGRSAPIARIVLDDGTEYLNVAVEGVYEGQRIEIGESASIQLGNVLPLGRIPEGLYICNVENKPQDGGQLARASGAYATVKAHAGDETIIQLSSGAMKTLSSKCLATIGIVAGGGRTEKVFLKAGNKYYAMKAKGHKWPRVRGVAMNPVSHPFGGGSHQAPGRSKTVSRHAPPGAKVGSIAAKRSGRKKRK